MNKNKKGFTLIELLAVIVILAVIALIATPLILNVIDKAKQGAAKNSAYGYIDALEKDLTMKLMEDSSAVIPDSVVAADVAVKGTKPTSVSLYLANGEVKNGTMIVDGYVITIADGKITTVAK